MDANPQVESEINGIRQPLTDLRSRCDAPAPTAAPGASLQPALTVSCPARFSRRQRTQPLAVEELR